MTFDKILFFYFLIGIIYTVINGAVRKLDNDDWDLVWGWIIFWPVFFIAIVISLLNKLLKR